MKKIKILQVVGGLDRAGTETWIMHLMRKMNREMFQFDFLVHINKKFDYQLEAESMGSKIILCDSINNPIYYIRDLKKIIARGHYNVVHSHVHLFSGIVMRAANDSGVRTRITHSHSSSPIYGKNFIKNISNYWMRFNILKYSTNLISVSSSSGPSLYGKSWAADSRSSIISSGIPLDPFLNYVNSANQIRSELNIPEKSRVVGHVGRFVPVKNHDFFIDVAFEIIKDEKDVYFILIGDGPLIEIIKQKCHDLGIINNFRFLGVKSNIIDYLHIMDSFLFPSTFEGLGLAIVEAQLAGIPVIKSIRLPHDSEINSNIIFNLHGWNSCEWAKATLCSFSIVKKNEIPTSIEAMKKSRLNIEVSLRALSSLYNREII